MMRQTTKSGIAWVPTHIDPYGRVTAVRIFAGDLPAWQVVQVCLDAERVKISVINHVKRGQDEVLCVD